MDIKDIKVGMKVKLLGKHALFDEYDDIEDWFEDCIEWEGVQRIEEQGFGVVTNIDEDGDIWVSDDISNDVWCFLSSDVEPYEEELTGESTSIKTPKEWLLTPMVTFTSRNGFHCITLGDCTSYIIETGEVWDNELDENYNEDLQCVDISDDRFDIMSITYKDEVVWKRGVESMTLVDAIAKAVKFDKKLKYKDWEQFSSLSETLYLISENHNLIQEYNDKVWEVE